MANRHERRAAAAVGSPPTADKLDPNINASLFDIPSYYASGMQAAPFANEVIMTFHVGQPGVAIVNGEQINVARANPILNVTLSMQTFKEMVVAMQSVVEAYEKENGEITTPFLKAQKA